MTNTQKSAKTTAKTTAKAAPEAETKAEAFTAEERSAMKERAKEVRASARRGSRADKAAEEEAAVVAKIAEMQDSDRVMAERIHAVVKESAPELAPKLWYGMPAYAKDGKVVCFFQSAQKFNARYATFGFNDVANLDDGTMWPAAFALKELSAADEARIAELVKKAVS
ncbi:iron chaperone [Streptomyces gardneri]|uniref:iron chaperone n=1 Tax=Streptomyces gardneri TaxID=66892 RepID=UPI0036AE4569